MKKNTNYWQVFTSAMLIFLSTQSLATAGNNLNQKNNQSEVVIKNIQDLENTSKKPIPLPKLLAQNMQNNSNPEVLVPNPTIRIDGKPAQPSQPSPPPFLPRAVAPPVGDMAVSNITNTSPPLIQLRTNAILPRLVLKEAPTQEVLSLLARSAGYNLVFSESETDTDDSTVSLEMENVSIEDAFNWVLMISGLSAGQKGNTIFVGSNLPIAARNVVTRSIRLNQYSVPGAVQFLGSQGASVKFVDAELGEGDEGQVTFNIKETYLQEAEGERLVLRGLTVHGDEINNSVVLIGPAHLVEIATNFLTQLDVRRRQVAINVKVIVANLDNIQSWTTEWTFGNRDYQVTIDDGLIFNFFDGQFLTRFEAFLQAQIRSNNAKILSDPTLIVQEGQASEVELTERVLTSIETSYQIVGDDRAIPVTTPIFEDAGLNLGVAVQKIDDNGFVNVVVEPSLTAPTDSILFESEGGINTLTLLSTRSVSSGLIRLRDGQSLLLSGIIQESQISTVNKVPILGDLPLLGALFRSESNTTSRDELIVLLTPQIINDTDVYNGAGYNYNPSPETQEFLDNQGLTIPKN